MPDIFLNLVLNYRKENDMTQEEKDLVLKDLCARLTNGVICSIYREDDEGFGWRDAECKGYFQTNHSYEFYFEDVIAVDNIENIKPYLRPMSSMTNEEDEWLNDRINFSRDDEVDKIRQKWGIVMLEIYNNSGRYVFSNFTEILDWLNAHHFDYRGLIGMGLALEAPEDMYN